VLVVDGGRVVEDGAPSDLRERSGAYGQLHRQWVESLA
jgi:ABC-type multidrug transport system fused ATPase/permease subunit